MIITSKGAGRPSMMPEGTWRARVARITPYGDNAGKILVAFIGTQGDAENTEAVDFINLATQEWRIREIYEAATGAKYPEEGEQWDTAEVIDQEVMVECEHQEYNGKVTAKAVHVFPVA